MKSKYWLIIFISIVVLLLGAFGGLVVFVDPYFHYHAPRLDLFNYHLDGEDQRSLNDGILKHFDYDAILTGTSMTENFKNSELDALFGVKSVKASYSGGTYKEVHDMLKPVLERRSDIKMIVWSVDPNYVFFDKDYVMDDLFEAPEYLYDRNPFNDVNYIFNHDIIFDKILLPYYFMRAYKMKPGITSFDEYSNWSNVYTYGRRSTVWDDYVYNGPAGQTHMTEEEKETLKASVRQNLTSLPAKYPNVRFYFFIPPYSAFWWAEAEEGGVAVKQIEAERILIEELLQFDNICLFGFDDMFDITTDLNNYKDKIHYGSWINSEILQDMKEGRGLLTKDNYQDYLGRVESFYASYDFNVLVQQEDYENDGYAAVVRKIDPQNSNALTYDYDMLAACELRSAEVAADLYEGNPGVLCRGVLEVPNISEEAIGSYLYEEDFCGIRIGISDATQYNMLSFYGRKADGNGQPSVYVYDRTGKAVAHVYASSSETDGEWHFYYLDISSLEGEITVIMNGACVDGAGGPESAYVFAGIQLR